MISLPICIAVRNGRRPTVYHSMDEAIFSLYGWPDADYKKCASPQEALLYMKKAPLEYPRWFRLLVCPETKDDLTEPTIAEASSEEFRQTFRQMRIKGFPETRFPAWFMEKITQEDREQADRDVQAPTQAPRPGQSDVSNDFGPEHLSTRTWKSPSIQSQAATTARALQSQMQLMLSNQEQQTERRLLHSIRSSSEDHGQRPSASSSLDPAQQYPWPVNDLKSSEVSIRSAQTISSNHQDDLNNKISRWRLITESRHDPSEPEDKPDDTDASSYDDDVRCELETLMWAFSSATLGLTPTSAMILGSPGRPNEDWAQSFNPATDQVDLWGITEKEVQLKFVNECLGPIANRYFNLHYYSQASKAVFVQAYCLHRGCFGDFLQHVFRRGVLPRIAVYVWELLGRSFNWKAVLKARIAVRDLAPSGSSNVDADPAKINFGECSECKGKKLVVKSAGKSA